MPEKTDAAPNLTRRHLRFGWWLVFVSTTLGLVLELLHGFKVPWYLGVASESRRLMWTLAHAHGTLLGLVNVAYAVSLPHMTPPASSGGLASPAILASSIILPAGFFIGGVFIHGGDPGLGSLLVPLGAVILIFGLWFVARRA